MKVQYTKPHVGGASAPLMQDVRVEELPDQTATEVDGAATLVPTPVPAGATLVDPAAAVHDWQPQYIPAAVPTAAAPSF